MKKSLLLLVCILFISANSSVQAIDFSAVKNVAGSAVKAAAASQTNESEKNAKEEAFKKQFQASLDNANKSLVASNKLAQDSVWTLADIILDESAVNSLKEKQSSINSNNELSVEDKKKQLVSVQKELIKALNTKLKSKDFDSSNLTSDNKEYVKAVTNLQIAQNRYRNINNNMSPNFRKFLEGEASIMSAKSQLIESGKVTKNVQSASMGIGSILGKLRKINEVNNVEIIIPDNEKVVYNKDGVVGSINYELDSINQNVNKSYSNLITAFNLKNAIAEEKAKINNNPDLTKQEKEAQLKKVEADVLAAQLAEQAKADAQGNIKELTAKQSKAVSDAATSLIEAGFQYAAVGLACTKLGFQIGRQPLLAAPLALEVNQLKHTGQIIKENAVSVKTVVGQIRRVAKANNITVQMPENTKSKAKKTNLNLNK